MGGAITTGVMIDAAPTRDHVRALVDKGMTQQAICRAANVGQAALSALLHGGYEPGRPPQKTIYSATADRLLAVQFESPTLREKAEPPCAPGKRFEPIGYRAGRCLDCGQVAPLHTRDGLVGLMRHPKPEPDAQTPDALPQAAEHHHPDCGTPRGPARHRRENTPMCTACRAFRRAYDQGWEAAAAKLRRDAAGTVPGPLSEAVVKAMRAFLHRRPYPQLRELAATVVRIADAELAVDTDGRAA